MKPGGHQSFSPPANLARSAASEVQQNQSGVVRRLSPFGPHPSHGRRSDLRRILLLGSGPIVIGQARFDYSRHPGLPGTRDEKGFSSGVVNSNPASIMNRSGDGGSHLHRTAHPDVCGR